MAGTGHIQLPNDWDEADDWIALGDEARLLFVDVLSSCSRRLTDGYLSPDALVRLRPSWTDPKRQAAMKRLVDGGTVARLGDGWQVLNWPTFGMTAAGLEAWLAEQGRKAVLGGKVRAATGARNPAGRFVRQPEVQPGGLDVASPKSSPVGWENPARTSSPNQPQYQYQVHDHVGTSPGNGTDAAWDGFAPAWSAFLDAWRERFRLPPTERQADALWTAVDAQPNLAASWVREAPAGAKAADVVRFVLDRWHAFVDSIPDDPEPKRRPAGPTAIGSILAALKDGE